MNRELVVSTDSMGIFSEQLRAHEIWRPIINGYRVPFGGLEIYNWRWREFPDLGRFVQNYSRSGIPVAGVHFRTGGVHDVYGWINRFKLLILNEAMHPTLKGMKELGWSENLYGLIHSPEVRNDHFMSVIKLEPKLMRKIKIENHAHVGSAGTALSIASELCQLGVNAGVMFDLCHEFSTSEYLPDARRVEMLVFNLKLILDAASRGEIKHVGVHDPEGTDWRDSLPKGKRGSLIRKEVANLINSPEYNRFVDVVVIEGQRLLPDSIILRQSQQKEVEIWAERTLINILTSGLISHN